MAGSSQVLNFQFHQPLHNKADHLAQNLCVGALLQKVLNAGLLIGRRQLLALAECVVAKLH